MKNTSNNAINNISRAYALCIGGLKIKLNDNVRKNFVAIFENIVNRYSEPHRVFHNIDHIWYVINNIKATKPETTLAAIYHDIIHVPGSRQNEYCSAQLAAKHLSILGVKYNVIMNVSKHILSTEQHIPIELIDNDELLDADMRILASDKPTFNKYCYDIRLEYPYISDTTFREERSRWALELMGRKQIYYSKRNFKLEEIARKNLRTLTKI